MNVVRIATGAAAILLIFGGVSYWISSQSTCLDFKERTLEVTSPTGATATLFIGLADIPAEQVRGLAGCSAIPQNSGLYFPYSNPELVSIWMKGMKIPIDIVWIADGQVIGLEEFVPPPTNTKTELLPQYKPSRPVNAVLEIEAGKAKEYSLEKGSMVIVR